MAVSGTHLESIIQSKDVESLAASLPSGEGGLQPLIGTIIQKGSNPSVTFLISNGQTPSQVVHERCNCTPCRLIRHLCGAIGLIVRVGKWLLPFTLLILQLI